MKRFALLLPALLLLACSDDATGPSETPDPFWSGTAPAVRLTLVRDAQGRADRTALVRVEALWDSAWTPGAVDRRVTLGGEDSSMRYAQGAAWYNDIRRANGTPQAPSTGLASFLVQGKTMSMEVPVYCSSKYDSAQLGAFLVQDEVTSNPKWKQPAVWIHCKD